MAVEERRLIALHRAAAEPWGEEVAEAPWWIWSCPPATSSPPARTSRVCSQRWQRWTNASTRGSCRCRSGGTHGSTWLRYELLSALDRRFADAVTLQTRTLVLSQLVALVVIAGLAFGLR